MKGHSKDLSQMSMLELFRMEVEGQAAELTRGLLNLERDPAASSEIPSLMRAAHSLKGAARIVGRDAAVRVSHAMEDCLTSLQRESRTASRAQIDGLLAAVDVLNEIALLNDSAIDPWLASESKRIETIFAKLQDRSEAAAPEIEMLTAAEPSRVSETAALRVSSETLGRLLSMAGETVVASRLLDEHSRDLLRLKRMHDHANTAFGGLRRKLLSEPHDESLVEHVMEVANRLAASAQQIAKEISKVDTFSRQFFNLSNRLHQEVLDARMRPFSEAAAGFPRMVRDVANELGKEVRLEIEGGSTEVDRDVIEQLKVPLMHLLRNAIDHGIESADVRRARAKPAFGTVRVHARHGGGMLLVSVIDDGNGIDKKALRESVVAKHLTTAELAERMSETELFQFLFLPGFSMKQAVTDISGRGVGLDVVQTAMRQVGGAIRVSSQHGKGTRFELELPLTLAMVRALLVDISGEAYAFPLSRVTAVAKLQKSDVESTEGRQHFKFRNTNVGLLASHQLLDLDPPPPANDVCAVVISDENGGLYGIAVDRFIGERELVVLALDTALGKVRNVSAGALMPDDSPVLILDVDDLLRSVENLVAGSRLAHVIGDAQRPQEKRRKRILAVDDSLTVRELERKLLQSQGYIVETAVDGMDAWNTIRHGHYDLLVTDVDMPRMDGIELVTLIRKDPKLRTLPVMIVSYKDRDIDRRRGLDAGADYYLTKGSFQDQTLMQAVKDLIGDPES